MHKKTAVRYTSALLQFPIPNTAWEKLAIEIVGPLENSPSECCNAVTLPDFYSKWSEIGFTVHATPVTVIILLSTVFSREGNPKKLVLDNGSQITSLEFSLMPTYSRQIEKFNI